MLQTQPIAAALAAACSLAATAHAQLDFSSRVVPVCNPRTAVEFISPMPTEQVPVFHGGSPESWHVILELAIDQKPGVQVTPIFEGQYIPSPGYAAPIPTDVNGDTVLGDPHPAFPGLTITMDDDLFVLGTLIPAGTNLASFIEQIGSEIEHGRKQSTTVTWVIDPSYMLIDINGDMGTNIVATLNGVTDVVFATHGTDPLYMPCSLPSTPTVSIFTADWISRVDSDVASDQHEAFLVGLEVRIPCYWDFSTNPPTPIPLDPVPGPGFAGQVITGNFPFIPGPGPHPMWPTVYLTFSDDYIDTPTGSGVGGGIVSGGTCATIYGVTGPNLAFALEQGTVSAWFGVDGIPNLAIGVADDQMIYRFTMIADGMIFDSDVLPMEMMITATVETECNLFSITNVRVKHHPAIRTPDPGP